jgi:hypothetical protein
MFANRLKEKKVRLQGGKALAKELIEDNTTFVKSLMREDAEYLFS